MLLTFSISILTNWLLLSILIGNVRAHYGYSYLQLTRFNLVRTWDEDE